MMSRFFVIMLMVFLRFPKTGVRCKSGMDRMSPVPEFLHELLRYYPLFVVHVKYF